MAAPATKAASGLCEVAGCVEPVAVVGDPGATRAFTKCRRCLVDKGWFKRAAQSRVFALLPAFRQPQGYPATAFGFRMPGAPVGVNAGFDPMRRGKWGMKIGVNDLARNFKRSVAVYARNACPIDWNRAGTFRLDIHSVFISPAADRDGPTKFVQDALQGIAYENDNQVLSGDSTKSPPDGAPRIEVVVRRLT